MTNLVQMIYISRSTFMTTELSNGIEPNVARILLKSRANNKKNGLVGVLYFGDGCFFQCLEGAAEAVDKLYETLLKDTRHKDIKILSRTQIDALSFLNWSMKHVPLEDEMIKLLKNNGLNKFDPYKFSAEMTKKTLELLHSKNDATETVLLKDLNQKAMQSDNETEQILNTQEDNKKLIKYVAFALFAATILLVLLKAL